MAEAPGFSVVGIGGSPVAAIISGSSGSGQSKDWYKCFIATAAYGTPLAREVDTLRKFRDQYLLTNSVGKIFTQCYYQYSPPLARLIAHHGILRGMTRTVLRPVVWTSSFVVYTNAIEKIMVLVLLMILGVFLVRTRVLRVIYYTTPLIPLNKGGMKGANPP